MLDFPKEIIAEDFILRAVLHKRYAPKLVTLVSKNIKEFKYIPMTSTLTTLDRANTHIDYHKEAWKKGNGYYYFIFDSELIRSEPFRVHQQPLQREHQGHRKALLLW